ncbi:oligosaccharide flippase family protein [Mangrovibacterium lignilyticum]|uniref:oligosaccharide flippase family protein n=1 Tax=Mangrovibacterium lignilyticum TaxID=2668052 RepID=UPI0013D6D6B8|nr:oligosaccharide flippase family protein [Mangrovibacterium lignilyticum]
MKVNQLKAGVFLAYFVIGLNALVGIMYTPYMLRKLGQSEYGLYSLVASIIAYLTLFDLGFGNSIIRFTAKYRAEGREKEQSELYGMFMILYCLIGLVTFISGLGLYYNTNLIFGETLSDGEIYKAKIMVLIMIGNLAISFPLGLFSSIILAYERFIFQRTIQTIRILLNTIVMIVILEAGYKAIGLVVVLSIFNLSSLLSHMIFSVTKLKVKFSFMHFRFSLLKEITEYSFYIFLNSIMDKIYWSTGQFILGAYSGTKAIAVFAVSIQLQRIFIISSQAISSVFLPRITGLTVKSNNDKNISDLFVRTGRLQFIVMSLILIGFIVFGKSFINFWAGENYSDAYYICLILFIPLTIPLIQNLGITILQARNQLKFRSILYVVIAGLSLLIQIPLAKRWEGIGVAVGVSSALILGNIIIMNIYYYKRQNINIPYFWRSIVQMSTIPLLFGVTSYFVIYYCPAANFIQLLLQIGSFAAIYLAIIWFFSANQEEKNLFIQPYLKLSKLISKK